MFSCKCNEYDYHKLGSINWNWVSLDTSQNKNKTAYNLVEI